MAIPCSSLDFPLHPFSLRMKIPMLLSAVVLIISGFIHIGLGAKQEVMTQHMLCTSAGHVWWAGIVGIVFGISAIVITVKSARKLALLWCVVAMSGGILAVLIDMIYVQELPTESRCFSSTTATVTSTTTSTSTLTSNLSSKGSDSIHQYRSDSSLGPLFETPLLLTLVVMMASLCLETLYMGPINLFIACHRCLCCDPRSIPYGSHENESATDTHFI